MITTGFEPGGYVVSSRSAVGTKHHYLRLLRLLSLCVVPAGLSHGRGVITPGSKPVVIMFRPDGTK